VPTPEELIALLDLEHDQERAFAASLGPGDRVAARDTFAHVIGARERMHEALVAHRTGAEPHSSHRRDELLAASAGRSFERLEDDAARVADALVADVRALDAQALASSPAWIGDATLADEILQQCVTHALVLMFEQMCGHGGAEAARGAQAAFVDALPGDVSALQRSRALYNLACLDVRVGRSSEAEGALTEALRLRPALAEQVRADPELEAVRDQVL
jgi:hypothetical protein